MGFDLAKLKAAISKAGQLKALVDPVRVESHMLDLENVLKGIHDVFGDGFQWSDVPKFIGEVVPDLMDVAKAFKEETGEEKKQFVVDSVVVIYQYYNPNLPWIPEPFETSLEKWIVPKIAEAAVEAAYKLGKKKGWWDVEPEPEPEAKPADAESVPDAENPPANDNAEPAADG